MTRVISGSARWPESRHPMPRQIPSKPRLRVAFSIAGALAFLALAFGASAQNAPPPPRDAVEKEETGPPVPEAVAIADIVATADSSATFLKEVAAALEGNATLGTGLPEVVAQIDERIATKDILLASQPTLAALRDAEAEWMALSKALDVFRNQLAEKVLQLEGNLARIDALDGRWKATLNALTAPDADETPPEVLARVRGIVDDLKSARENVVAERSRLLSVQERVAEQEKRSGDGVDRIHRARDTAVSELFVQLNPPLWGIDFKGGVLGVAAREIPAALDAQWKSLIPYLRQHTGHLLIHGVLLVFLLAAIHAIARHVKGWVRIDPELEDSCFVFDFPYSTAVILAVFCGSTLYPIPPVAWRSLLFAIALLPILRILKHPLPDDLRSVLGALVAFLVIDRLGDLTTAAPLAERLIFLAAMVGGILYLLWILRYRLSRDRAAAETHPIFRVLRRAALALLVLFGFALLADVLGYLPLSRHIGHGAIKATLIAAFLRAFVRIADGLVVFALRAPPLRKLGMVRRHRSLIERRTERLVRLLAVGSWVLATLEIFSILQPASSLLRTTLTASFPVENFSLSLGSFLAFGAAVYLSILASRFVRFLLAEEIYPRASLPRGVPFAISSVVHYALLLFGFFLALGIAGIDLTRITVLVGALGVGIGFGLQNIVNNFVSGLILLFERPVNVGDMVEVNAQVGELRRIGLRASVLRTPDGSEVIVPNGDLISSKVTNWTLSDQQRRLEIPVGVAYGTSPEQVIALLLGVADSHPDILKTPPPQALFVAFGESSLDFNLRAWTNEYQRWPVVRSELATAMWHALQAADIAIPFPQRDLHVLSVPERPSDVSDPPGPSGPPA